MTATPETKFTCNRCSHETYAALENVSPHQRMAGPDGWMYLLVSAEPGTQPKHLCPDCASDFQTFMMFNEGR